MKYQIKNLLIGAMMVIAFGSCSEQEPDVFQDINDIPEGFTVPEGKIRLT